MATEDSPHQHEGWAHFNDTVSRDYYFFMCHIWFLDAVLRSRNYLFSARATAPTLSIISAPASAPATAIYCHLKLFLKEYYYTNRSRNQLLFVLASSKLNAENVYLNLFSASAPGPQIISAPPAPAPQHCLDAVQFQFCFSLSSVYLI